MDVVNLSLVAFALAIVGLSVLPPGRIALAGLGLGFAATLGVIFLLDDGNTGFRFLPATALSVGVTVATVVQLSRHLRRDMPMLALLAILAVMMGLSIYLLKGL